MKILFLAPYPINNAPSQRFRFEHFLEDLTTHGYTWHFQSFLSENGWTVLYEKGNILRKIMAVLNGYLRRIGCLFRLAPYDYIFIHRETSPFGPPIFEFIITKILQKPIIYDFDDAIWLADQTQENWLWKTAKWRGKVGQICRWSWKVTAGNEFLAAYAHKFCDRVIILPTVVNTNIHKRTDTPIQKEKLTIGWTGSHSTLFYLIELLPVLKKLEQMHDFEFLVIANKNPQLELKNFRFVKWTEKKEVKDLMQIDIGVMPLLPSEWAKGKCGFKLIQYMSLGIASVSSPVGVNIDIIEDGKTGLLASGESEWFHCLSQLLTNEKLRQDLGISGSHLIQNAYSVKSQKVKFLNLFAE